MLWVILFAGAVGTVVFIERYLHCHRSQINSAEFLNGVRTVLKRDNIVEALSICDATPGPVSRLVKTAILTRDQGRERVREAIEEAGLIEVEKHSQQRVYSLAEAFRSRMKPGTQTLDLGCCQFHLDQFEGE